MLGLRNSRHFMVYHDAHKRRQGQYLQGVRGHQGQRLGGVLNFIQLNTEYEKGRENGK